MSASDSNPDSNFYEYLTWLVLAVFGTSVTGLCCYGWGSGYVSDTFCLSCDCRRSERSLFCCCCDPPFKTLKDTPNHAHEQRWSVPLQIGFCYSIGAIGLLLIIIPFCDVCDYTTLESITSCINGGIYLLISIFLLISAMSRGSNEHFHNSTKNALHVIRLFLNIDMTSGMVCEKDFLSLSH